ncbi:hypothetical protein NC652_034052 [Populus alba x Populus x berolinensis]|nr:hypothetical protein NC652_034052 [Populus alba x Populus x berolinensis]
MSLYQNSVTFVMLLAILGSYAPKLHLVPPREPVSPSVALDDGWITVEPRRKSNKHASSPLEEKITTPKEDDFGKAPCPNLAILVCANTADHQINIGDVITSECIEVVPTICTDFVTPEWVAVDLTIACSNLRTPNLEKKGILASRPLDPSLLRKLVRTTGKRNSKRTNAGSRKSSPSPASL